MIWGWRTKPRSVVKTVQWFKYFSKLENRDWNETLDILDIYNRKIHPLRREFVYTAHKDDDEYFSSISFDDYISGLFDDKADKESNARNDLATFKFFGFGYIDDDGYVKSTNVGKLIENDRFDSETFLKQLLKLHFPCASSDYGKDIPKGKTVFPLQILLKLLKDFEYINRYELGFIFACCDISEYDILKNAIIDFRTEYNNLDNKKNKIECEKIFSNIFKKYYNIEPNINTLCTDYGDAFQRALLYTNLFNVTGRGNYSKIRIAEHSKKKVELLLDKYIFKAYDSDNLKDYMMWYGNVDNVLLPWEDKDERKEIIREKIKLLDEKINSYQEKYHITIDNKIINYIEKLKNTNGNNELKILEKTLIKEITTLNEHIYTNYTSKNIESRQEILTKFDDIINGNEDLAALWLECNTWKSLVAINGDKDVKRNFTIEEDLSPKFFAPGKGNTPDMELYNDEYVIVPEVSLMTGVLQWEHEASSVIDHVLNIIKKYEDRDVIGLFISSKINIRTMWQFFILNKESWMGKPVPVIPLTIKQYMSILEFTYEKELDIDKFKNLLTFIHEEALKSENYEIWEKNIEQYIASWKVQI